MFLFLKRNKVPNVVLGACIGDALGIPFETMKATNKILLEWDCVSYGEGNAYTKTTPGQYSDDGQMSIMVAESLIENKGFNPDNLAERYVDWIYSGEARGFGGTTKTAVDRLHNGVHWSESGVQGSLGNGTAMRAGPFGIFFANDLDALTKAVKIDSAMTHMSDDAEAGALAIALSTALIYKNEWHCIPRVLNERLPACDTKTNILKAITMAFSNMAPAVALRIIGTSGNVRETVPAAIYCYMKFNSYDKSVISAIKAGGDTDTTAAIVGAMTGAETKISDIPGTWIKKLENVDHIMKLDTLLTKHL